MLLSRRFPGTSLVGTPSSVPRCLPCGAEKGVTLDASSTFVRVSVILFRSRRTYKRQRRRRVNPPPLATTARNRALWRIMIAVETVNPGDDTHSVDRPQGNASGHFAASIAPGATVARKTVHHHCPSPEYKCNQACRMSCDRQNSDILLARGPVECLSSTAQLPSTRLSASCTPGEQQ